MYLCFYATRSASSYQSITRARNLLKVLLREMIEYFSCFIIYIKFSVDQRRSQNCREGVQKIFLAQNPSNFENLKAPQRWKNLFFNSRIHTPGSLSRHRGWKHCLILMYLRTRTYISGTLKATFVVQTMKSNRF